MTDYSKYKDYPWFLHYKFKSPEYNPAHIVGKTVEEVIEIDPIFLEELLRKDAEKRKDPNYKAMYFNLQPESARQRVYDAAAKAKVVKGDAAHVDSFGMTKVYPVTSVGELVDAIESIREKTNYEEIRVRFSDDDHRTVSKVGISLRASIHRDSNTLMITIAKLPLK